MSSPTGPATPTTKNSVRAGWRGASRARCPSRSRLHVPAKRYLCATDAAYHARLSPASVHTLALQGGPMSAQEVVRFQAEPFGADAVRLRRWDDQGKVAGLRTQALGDYVGLIERWATTLPG